jgi:uncharacterized protein YjbJ (UPF0337 family)
MQNPAIIPGDDRAGERMVDQNRVDGAASQIKGKVKVAVGKITNDQKLQADGEADQIVGEAQQKLGEFKDKLRSALK